MPNYCTCDDCRAARGEIPACVDCTAAIYRGDVGYSDGMCPACTELEDDYYNGDSGGDYLRNYSFTPYPLNFYKTGDDPDEKLFMGFELEVPGNGGSIAEAVYNGPGQRERFLYCKEDGSITGAEIVSHPMTHAYFRENFPFEMFKSGSDVSGYVEGRPPSNYGMHVHVSRDGFKGESHALRWLLLIYRNAEDMAKLARRTSLDWASYTDADRCADKAKGDRGGARYVAVNCQNEATYEVRVFRSTWNEQEFRAAVDFCHASVVYTRQLTAHAALRGGLKWAAFREWLNDRPEYAALAAEIDKHADD